MLAASFLTIMVSEHVAYSGELEPEFITEAILGRMT
jgi:hypothetical protein